MKRLLLLGGFALASLAGYATNLTSGQTYKIALSDEVLSLENSSLSDGATINVWAETNVNAQRWVLEDDGNGSYLWRNAYSEHPLANNGTTACLSHTTSTSTSWEMEEVENADNLYYIKHVETGLYLDILSSTTMQVGLASKKTGSWAVNQQWSIEAVDASPNDFTTTYRDEMMDDWKTRYYTEWTTTARIQGNAGFWGHVEMFEIILDAYEATGEQTYITMFTKLFAEFTASSREGTDWSSNNYNDDIAWGVIASVRGYLMTGTSSYLTIAKDNFDMMYARAAVLPEGTLVWNAVDDIGDPRGTNSCVNGPAMVAACYLAIATEDDSYYEKARSIYEGQRNNLFVASTGQVYDCLVWGDNDVPGDYNYWTSTYNQGTFIGSAVMLYNRYQEDTYMQDAIMAMKYTRQYLCNEFDIISACQGVVNDDGSLVGDLPGFKGVLMRYVRRFMVDLYQPDCAEWIAANAYHAYNNRNSEGITSTAWLSKTDEEYTESAPFTTYNNDPFGASTSVSAAFNTYLGKNIRKEPFVGIEAENFDYIMGIYTEQADDISTPVMGGTMLAGAYTGYHNVNFGSTCATDIEITLKPLRQGSVITVHQGSFDGEVLATIEFSEAGDWQTVSAELSKPLDGTQAIYLKYARSTGAALFQIDNFKFVAGGNESTASADVTDNLGVVSTSMTALDGYAIENVIDNRATTTFIGSVASDGSAWIQYQSPYPVLLQGYRLVGAAGSEVSNPTAWELKASNDGTNWSTIETQTTQGFDTDYCMHQYDVTTTNAYSYFRLSFLEETAIQLADWQLFGAALADYSILSDDGLFDAQSNQDVENLQDMDIETTYYVEDSTFSIVYQPTAFYDIAAYNITTSEDAESDPSAWAIYASQDGEAWDLLDQRVEQQFPYRKATYTYPITSLPTTTPDLIYNYYKIEVTANNGGTATEIAEWQLLGDFTPHTYYNDITSNRGVLVSSDNSSNVASSGLQNLIDNDGTTYYTFEEQNKWVEYLSPYSVTLNSFALVSASNLENLPTTVFVEYMDEGDTSYRRAYYGEITFTSRNERLFVECDRAVTGKNFRITLDTAATLSQIELYGVSVLSDDLTVGAEISALYEGLSDSEQVSSLIDNNYSTKYCADFPGSTWITCKLSSPSAINLYTLTSASSAEAQRDPRAWTLESSNDGVTWTTLDERSEQLFSSGYTTQFYACECQESYLYYRLVISENNGESILQLSEWQLLSVESPLASTPTTLFSTESAMMVYREGTLSIKSTHTAHITLYSLQGAALYNTVVEAGISTRSLALPKGLYISKIVFENQTITQKLLID